MPEPMTSQLVAEVLTDLLEAFPPYRGKESFNVQRKASIYRDGLLGLSGDALRAAAKIAIQNDDRFPKVARLRELASQWTRRNCAVLPSASNDPMQCGACGARAEWDGKRYQIAHDPRKHGVFVSSAEDT